ncbi:MAG: lysyl oxidase family protein [Candidatus Binatia bacterium]
MVRWCLPLVVVLGCILATGAAAQNARCQPPASTYELIQHGIFERHGCTQSYCHGASRQEGLDLRANVSYENLLHEELAENGVRDKGSDGLELVNPGRPNQSLLWLTLAAKTLRLRGVPSAPMPIDGLPLTRDELEGVRLWILAGAPANGFVGGVSDLIDACPPPARAGELPPPCNVNDPSLLLPDLAPDPPRDIRVRYRGGHRVIEFTTAVANIGDGPLVVQAASRPTGPGESLNAVQILDRADGSKCSRPAGAILFEFEGKHWAYGNMAGFELRVGDPATGPVLARSSKTAFCLLDTDPIRASEDLPHQFEAHCEDDIGRMGVSVGYKDVYHRVHPGQWIDLDADPTTPVEPGNYYLVNVIDPNKTLLEVDSSREANASYTRVSIRLPEPDVTEAGAVQPAGPTGAVQPAPPAPGQRR